MTDPMTRRTAEVAATAAGSGCGAIIIILTLP